MSVVGRRRRPGREDKPVPLAWWRALAKSRLAGEGFTPELWPGKGVAKSNSHSQLVV
jgi:hypothetical protein